MDAMPQWRWLSQLSQLSQETLMALPAITATPGGSPRSQPTAGEAYATLAR